MKLQANMSCHLGPESCPSVSLGHKKYCERGVKEGKHTLHRFYKFPFIGHHTGRSRHLLVFLLDILWYESRHVGYIFNHTQCFNFHRVQWDMIPTVHSWRFQVQRKCKVETKSKVLGFVPLKSESNGWESIEHRLLIFRRRNMKLSEL